MKLGFKFLSNMLTKEGQTIVYHNMSRKQKIDKKATNHIAVKYKLATWDTHKQNEITCT